MSDLPPNQLNPRSLPPAWDPTLDHALAFHTNDYLGLSRHPEVIAASQAAAARFGTSSTGSRLLSGNFSLHTELETQLAQFKGFPEALLFNTGFSANMALLTTLATAGDLIIADRLNHASLIDGALHSSAKAWHYDHSDLEHAAELLAKPCSGRKFIATDAVFSMDGDIARLPELVALAKKHDAILIVDEAHSTGVLGKTGKGIFEHFGLNPDPVNTAVMGTCGKALGSFGAFVACSKSIKETLINKARAFIYSTALPPSVLGATQAALALLQPERIVALRERTAFFHALLQKAEILTLPGSGATPIFPIVLGQSALALETAKQLKDAGFLTMAVRPPTVAEGTARLRLTITAHHTEENLKALVEALKKILPSSARTGAHP